METLLHECVNCFITSKAFSTVSSIIHQFKLTENTQNQWMLFGNFLIEITTLFLVMGLLFYFGCYTKSHYPSEAKNIRFDNWKIETTSLFLVVACYCPVHQGMSHVRHKKIIENLQHCRKHCLLLDNDISCLSRDNMLRLTSSSHVKLHNWGSIIGSPGIHFLYVKSAPSFQDYCVGNTPTWLLHSSWQMKCSCCHTSVINK